MTLALIESIRRRVAPTPAEVCERDGHVWDEWTLRRLASLGMPPYVTGCSRCHEWLQWDTEYATGPPRVIARDSRATR